MSEASNATGIPVPNPEVVRRIFNAFNLTELLAKAFPAFALSTLCKKFIDVLNHQILS